jgi:hypothetical protein
MAKKISELKRRMAVRQSSNPEAALVDEWMEFSGEWQGKGRGG